MAIRRLKPQELVREDLKVMFKKLVYLLVSKKLLDKSDLEYLKGAIDKINKEEMK